MRLLFGDIFSNISEFFKLTIMRNFKIADMWFSITLIVGFMVYCITAQDIEYLFIGYFVVGGWQVVSMLVHAATRTFTYTGGARVIYHWVTFFSLVTMPLGSFWILWFIAPFMAVFYTWLCYHEVYVKMKRPLADLK
jgi:hypothetical protein